MKTSLGAEIKLSIEIRINRMLGLKPQLIIITKKVIESYVIAGQETRSAKMIEGPKQSIQ